jgi:hypothetical protein
MLLDAGNGSLLVLLLSILKPQAHSLYCNVGIGYRDTHSSYALLQVVFFIILRMFLDFFLCHFQTYQSLKQLLLVVPLL